MARTNLKTVSVYVTDEQHALLTKGAGRVNRSLSNFLLAEGLEKCEEMGVASQGQVDRANPAGRRVAGV